MSKSALKCPNCKERYVYKESDDEEYPVLLDHINSLCPYGIEIYSDTQKEARKMAESYIKELRGKFGGK